MTPKASSRTRAARRSQRRATVPRPTGAGVEQVLTEHSVPDGYDSGPTSPPFQPAVEELDAVLNGNPKRARSATTLCTTSGRGSAQRPPRSATTSEAGEGWTRHSWTSGFDLPRAAVKYAPLQSLEHSASSSAHCVTRPRTCSTSARPSPSPSPSPNVAAASLLAARRGTDSAHRGGAPTRALTVSLGAPGNATTGLPVVSCPVCATRGGPSSAASRRRLAALLHRP